MTDLNSTVSIIMWSINVINTPIKGVILYIYEVIAKMEKVTL